MNPNQYQIPCHMIRKFIKNCPPLLYIIRLFRTGFVTGHDIMRHLPHYTPLAEGPQKFRSRITLLAARQTDPLLAELADQYRASSVETVGIEQFCSDELRMKKAAKLADLFNEYGSDKSTAHDYHLLYGALLADSTENELDILEIGLGTNNTRILANMGNQGKPGASLRAFRDYLPNSHIFGADIDRKILFSEERIKTFPVDQLDSQSFDDLSRNLGERKFDLIIDDGLHVPNANLNTLLFGLRLLKNDGCMVVEDISNESLSIWKIASVILSERYQTHIVRCRGGNMFVVAKADSNKKLLSPPA